MGDPLRDLLFAARLRLDACASYLRHRGWPEEADRCDATVAEIDRVMAAAPAPAAIVPAAPEDVAALRELVDQDCPHEEPGRRARWYAGQSGILRAALRTAVNLIGEGRARLAAETARAEALTLCCSDPQPELDDAKPCCLTCDADWPDVPRFALLRRLAYEQGARYHASLRIYEIELALRERLGRAEAAAFLAEIDAEFGPEEDGDCPVGPTVSALIARAEAAEARVRDLEWALLEHGIEQVRGPGSAYVACRACRTTTSYDPREVSYTDAARSMEHAHGCDIGAALEVPRG